MRAASTLVHQSSAELAAHTYAQNPVLVLFPGVPGMETIEKMELILSPLLAEDRRQDECFGIDVLEVGLGTVGVVESRWETGDVITHAELRFSSCAEEAGAAIWLTNHPGRIPLCGRQAKPCTNNKTRVSKAKAGRPL